MSFGCPNCGAKVYPGRRRSWAYLWCDCAVVMEHRGEIYSMADLLAVEA